MNRRILIAIFILVGTVWTLGAQQITRVAVLDYERILSAFYAGSESARRIEEMKTIFAEDVRILQEEIQDLEIRRLEAENRGDARAALDLDSRIQERTQYYQDFVRVRGNQIQTEMQNLARSAGLAQEILREVQYVAESNGYALVLKRSDPNLLWWSYETDITELVLQRLMNN